MTTGNLTTRGRARRMIAGVLLLMLSLGAAVGLFVLRFHPAWRVLLVIPLWIAILDVWQAAGSC